MKKKTVVAAALTAAMTMPMSLTAFASEATEVTIDQITLGEDYTDVEAELNGEEYLDQTYLLITLE